ncbi:MAG: AbgT family transporter [Phycisphaeraceae bacterium]|nr:AbgT family transporter [Phycisphaeraceae bacterium]
MSTDQQSNEGRKGILDFIERVGNALPDPATLFLIGAVLVMVVSHIGFKAGWTVQKPGIAAVTTPVIDSGTGEPVTHTRMEVVKRVPTLVTDKDHETGAVTARIEAVTNAEYEMVENDKGELVPTLKTKRIDQDVKVVSLLDREGVNWVFHNMVKNFTSFAPLGIVLVAMLGIGVAEKTGFIGTLLKAMMLLTPQKLLTPTVVFIGIMSSMASDAGYVVLPPVAAALYKSVGRSPLVGLAAVFAGVSAGFSANLLITSLDPLLSGLTQVGAQLWEPGYKVNPACNYYFMIASTFMLTLLGWGVTAKLVEPRLARKSALEGGPSPLTDEDRAAQAMTPGEKRALVQSVAWTLLVTGGLLALILVPHAPLWKSPDEADARWPEALVPMVAIFFLVPGVVYGIITGTIKSETKSDRLDAGIAKLMAHTMADMGPYIVLAFFAAQFVEFFNHSNLGTMLAIVGGEALQSADVHPVLVLSLFILVVCAGNLFMGSASAKWAFFAPVFVPMFMKNGISPELTQAAYRVGDSATNIIAPMNPYLIIILVFMRKYMPKAGIGSLISLMIPYAVIFLIAWMLMLSIWYFTGQPLGPQGGLHYDNPMLN